MDLEELRAFLAVADAGSFLTAAKALRMPRATLRRRIDQLEARAGVALVDRSRTGADLTEAGKILAARGRLMVQESNALLQSVREVGAEPSGLLRVLLPVGMPPHVLVPVLGLARKYPRIVLQLRFSDDPVAGLLENMDLAIHFGDESPAGPWISREIMRANVRLMAAREYLVRRGTPQSIDDLKGHDLIAWEGLGDEGRQWPLLRGGAFPAMPNVTTRDVHILWQLIISGFGIGLVPDVNIAHPGVAEDALVPVLPKIVGREIGVRVIVPAVLSEVPRIKVMLELIEPYLGRFGL